MNGRPIDDLDALKAEWHASQDNGTQPASAEGLSWEDPLPLPGTGALPAFPVDALPPLVAEYAKAVAEAHAIPVDLAALACLGALSVVVTGAVEVELAPAWREPANLYLLGVADVGEAKTPTWAEVGEELFAIERGRQERAAPKIAEAEAMASIARQRAKDTQQEAARAKGDKRQVAEGLAREAATEAATLVVPTPPRLVAMETTPEALVKLADVNRGRLGMWADEGGEVFAMMSRYSGDGKANLGACLKGWDGKPYSSDRAGREAIAVPKLTTAMVLAVQPQVLRDLAQDKANRGRGVLARFLYSLPRSNVGNRPTVRRPIPDDLRDRWRKLLRDLAAEAEGKDTPVVLELTSAASERFATWRAKHEPRLHPNSGDLRGIRDWGNKLPGQVGRLALVLSVSSVGSLRQPISEETTTNTLTLADYFTPHALRAFGAMEADPATAGAVEVLAWLETREDRLATFTRRDAMRARPGRLPNSEAAEAVLRLLEDTGWVQPVHVDPGTKGGHPPAAYAVNPKVADTTDTTPRNLAPRSPETADTTDTTLVGTGCVGSVSHSPVSQHDQDPPPTDADLARWEAEMVEEVDR